MTKPDTKDVMAPWQIVDCNCGSNCERCNGYGWYYLNRDTGTEISEMLRSAMERHG